MKVDVKKGDSELIFQSALHSHLQVLIELGEGEGREAFEKLESFFKESPSGSVRTFLAHKQASGSAFELILIRPWKG